MCFCSFSCDFDLYFFIIGTIYHYYFVVFDKNLTFALNEKENKLHANNHLARVPARGRSNTICARCRRVLGLISLPDNLVCPVVGLFVHPFFYRGMDSDWRVSHSSDFPHLRIL